MGFPGFAAVWHFRTGWGKRKSPGGAAAERVGQGACRGKGGKSGCCFAGLLQAGAEGGRLGFVAGLVEQGEHVFLVGLDAGLVEGIHAEQQAADAAGALEEVEELAEVVLVELRQGDFQVGHAAVHVGELGAEFGHFVHFVHALAGQEVEAVEVLLVGGDAEAAVGLFDGEHGLEDGALAVLDPLAHGVEVGGEVDGCGEDAFVLLALALAVELFPPLADVVEFGVVVGEDFDFLAALVEGVAHGGVDGAGVLAEGGAYGGGLLHGYGALHEGFDVEPGHGDGQEAYGGEHGEAAAHVVGDDEAGVAFLVGRGAGCAAAGVGDGYDDFAGHFLAALVFALFLEEAEGEGGLGGRTGFGYVDHAEVLVLEVFGQLGEVVFADVVSGIDEHGVVLLAGHEPGETVAEGFYYGAGAEVAAADAGHHYYFAVLAQRFGRGLEAGQVGGGDGGGQVEPAEEVIARGSALFEGLVGGFGLLCIGLKGSFGKETEGLFDVEVD